MKTLAYKIIDAGTCDQLENKVNTFLQDRRSDGWSLVGPVQVTTNGPGHWFYQTLVQEF